MDTSKGFLIYSRLDSLRYRPDFKWDESYHATKMAVYRSITNNETLSNFTLGNILSYLSDYRPVINKSVILTSMNKFCLPCHLSEYGNAYSFAPIRDRREFLQFAEKQTHKSIKVYDVLFQDAMAFFRVKRNWFVSDKHKVYLFSDAINALSDNLDANSLVSHAKRLSMFAQKPNIDPEDIINLVCFISNIPITQMVCMSNPKHNKSNTIKFNIACKAELTSDWRERIKKLLDIYIPDHRILLSPSHYKNTEILSIENPCTEPNYDELMSIVENFKKP